MMTTRAAIPSVGCSDKNGNVLRYEEDGDSDGTVDQFADWHYDAMGRPTRF